MDLTLRSRLKHSWNTFMNRDPTDIYNNTGYSSTYRPDRSKLSRGNERTIVTSIINRISLDVSSINVNHCRTDSSGRFIGSIDSCLNKCLTLEANLDQTGRAFMQDVVMSMLDEGSVAIVPIDTSVNPSETSSYDILSMRTGKIVEWYPKHVKVSVYNEETGRREDIKVPKASVAIIENPLYSVMNEPNSTMQRLMRKLALLDGVDERSSTGKLDMIIQLPYVIKSEARRKEADKRRTELETQLSNSVYGIGYIDGTEKVTQLNRPLDNNLMKQIEYLTTLLYSQLNITQSILDGTADEQTLLNYYTRTIEPMLSAIIDEMIRKFLTKTARSQNQTIKFFRDPFKLVPVSSLAETADKFTRNEIMSSNEFRQVIGLRPSDDPNADKLRNSNLNHPETEQSQSENPLHTKTSNQVNEQKPIEQQTT